MSHWLSPLTSHYPCFIITLCFTHFLFNLNISGLNTRQDSLLHRNVTLSVFKAIWFICQNSVQVRVEYCIMFPLKFFWPLVLLLRPNPNHIFSLSTYSPEVRIHFSSLPELCLACCPPVHTSPFQQSCFPSSKSLVCIVADV